MDEEEGSLGVVAEVHRGAEELEDSVGGGRREGLVGRREDRALAVVEEALPGLAAEATESCLMQVCVCCRFDEVKRKASKTVALG